MKVIIDRFEGNYAVCEGKNGAIISIEKSKVPINSKEGDVLDIQKENITIDNEATESRREQINKLVKDVWGN